MITTALKEDAPPLDHKNFVNTIRHNMITSMHCSLQKSFYRERCHASRLWNVAKLLQHQPINCINSLCIICTLP